VYEISLKAHLQVCNKKKMRDMVEAQPFFVRNINGGGGARVVPPAPAAEIAAASASSSANTLAVPKKMTITEKLSSLGITSLRPFFDRVSVAFHNHYDERNTVPHTLRPFAMSPLFSAAEGQGSGQKVFKHLKQQASIIGHMQRRALLPRVKAAAAAGLHSVHVPPTSQPQASAPHVFCEFGAGRGMLAATIGEVSNPALSNFLMIERNGARKKGDHLLRSGKTQWSKGVDNSSADATQTHAHTERIRIDIRDLDLKGVGLVKDQRHIIGVGKHLCGVATDLTLRCLANTLPQLQGSSGSGSGFHGVAIATCCHHVCNWDDYIFPDFFKDCGFSGEDFDLVRTLSSWGVCGLGANKDSKSSKENNDDDDDDDEHNVPAETLPLDGGDKAWELSTAERTQLGRQCKRLIDVGRVKYLESVGLNAEVVHYVETSVSPENALILAWK
jgi:tRNA:m4X modification enzyme